MMCDCSCASKCPRGKIGSEPRCLIIETAPILHTDGDKIVLPIPLDAAAFRLNVTEATELYKALFLALCDVWGVD